MAIQWFPGHMTSARRKAAETLARTDLVVEVLDARIPAASANPMIEELRAFRQRPCLPRCVAVSRAYCFRCCSQ